ncbi:MAG: methylmalonyl Co-A mutase-associated GTPase MeaB [Calditrichota bacterium]
MKLKQENINHFYFKNFRDLARAISLVENDNPGGEELLKTIFEYTGKAYRIGVTGPPGAGKSTLVSQMVKRYRLERLKIGVIAVDPTSPYSGGALLGDRIRMIDLINDPGVFIRSMATRGSLGGLSNKAQDVADLMDAAGMDLVIFETIGVGQGELDIAKTTDTTLVVLVPESGDSIQAMKAGLMEIADIFVVNKSDRDGAEKMKIELEMMLQLKSADSEWLPPIINTIANMGEGIIELQSMVDKHKKTIIEKGILKDKKSQRALEKIKEVIKLKLEQDFWDKERTQLLDQQLPQVLIRNLSPYQLAEELFRK